MCILPNKSIDKKNPKLWKCSLTDEEFEALKKSLSYSNDVSIEPKEATFYYAEWWRRNYDGGKPSKEEVFNSIGGNIQYNLDAKEFFEIAKKGAEILGVKWIQKQNTLYFRTLLLQGGLPLYHISKHTSNYKDFLLSVLEIQPEKIEDFIFQPEIINLLPVTSRNDIIYENCFEIVRSILNDESTYDELLFSNDSIKNIIDDLKVRKLGLSRRIRSLKAQNYWLYNRIKNKINLRIGFADKYTQEGLSQVLGFEVTEKKYQFYLNDNLICVFRKMLSGGYKTDWHNQFSQEWDRDIDFPIAYVIADTKKIEVKDFIQLVPDLEKPTLWVPFSDDVWRLVKGNNTLYEKGMVIYPECWKSSENSIIAKKLYNCKVSLLEFEGEITLVRNDEKEYSYRTNVHSYDWTIVSHKPSWVLKSNLPIIKNRLEVLVYDEKNELLNPNQYNVYFKYHSVGQSWQLLSRGTSLPKGYIDIKIEKDGILAYDSCYNIGAFEVSFSDQTIESAEIIVNRNEGFQFILTETLPVDIHTNDMGYSVRLNDLNIIPNGIKARLKTGQSKSLLFEIKSPFSGVSLINDKGLVVNEECNISFNDLFGLRIFTPKDSTITLKMQNVLRKDVVIIKEIKESKQPLISYKDELMRLYYLADAMNYQNYVELLLVYNGITKKYKIARFSHFLDIEDQLNRRLKLFNENHGIDLYAVPLNCEPKNISLIPLDFGDNEYIIPVFEFSKQFIVISSKQANVQLMPRFVNTDVDYEGVSKTQRIETYCNTLHNSCFQSDVWKELLYYFNICIDQNLPFSTFDQIISLGRDSSLMARAFFYLGVNQYDTDEYIQKIIPELENDLGVCFHWIMKNDWKKAIEENSLCILNNTDF
ncbi:hypothetical protein [Riemerella anatipestifer]|uniref:hypothetical protein n=1 Tax=Riemerella anatipestifer TaxID=34085 RepID=UPI00285827A3|nr:hypothetical protein [Riemerella anatipestifer]MDR7732337.1 hypothetical protein [Riemerella anatipestifer]